MSVSQKGPRKRRRDVLEHKIHHDEQEPRLPDKTLQESMLRKIVHTLLVIDLVTLRVLTDLGIKTDELLYRLLIDGDPIASKLKLKAETCSTKHRLKTALLRREFVTLTWDQLNKRTTDTQKCQFHKKAMSLLRDSYEQTPLKHRFHDLEDIILFDDSDLQGDLDWEIQQRNEFAEDGAAFISGYTDEAGMLLLMIRKAQVLHRCAEEAFEKGYFDAQTRLSLKDRLEGLDKYFEDACETMRVPYDSLGYFIAPTPQPEQEPPINVAPELPITVLKSESEQRHTPFIFALLVPVICSISLGLTIHAWNRAELEKGKATDADFFQLLSSALLQLLGIATSLWPAVMSLSVNRTALCIKWGLAVGGAGLNVASIALYIFVSPRWSALLLCGGSVLQVFLHLQLVLAVNQFKEHHS